VVFSKINSEIKGSGSKLLSRFGCRKEKIVKEEKLFNCQEPENFHQLEVVKMGKRIDFSPLFLSMLGFLFFSITLYSARCNIGQSSQLNMLTSRYVLRQETQIRDTLGIISCKNDYYGTKNFNNTNKQLFYYGTKRFNK